GYTTSFGQGGQDIYLVKTDANGALMWSKTYGTSGNELAFGHCLQATSDGGYILTGPGGMGKKNIFLLKIDASGNVQWSKVYDGSFSHGVRQTPDGGYIIAGQSLVGNNIALIRTDAGGAVVWSEYYGSVGGAANAVELAGDGGYIAAGQANVGPFGKKDLYFIKTDSVGNSGCNQTNAGVTDSNFTFTVINPATIVGKGSWTASYTYAFTRGGQINNACSTVGINKISKDSYLNIYPNPAINDAVITFSEASARQISVYDVTGRIVRSFEATGNEYKFSCTGLSTGMYFIKVVSGENTQVVKFIKG
ncbi:MAG TPA: T9SS type A sorting domain-containing protein, partial [Bacteroidia bacterium]|nr:T9SS type A sorting domain-containing protein [Bacteroidia bacterium]